VGGFPDEGARFAIESVLSSGSMVASSVICRLKRARKSSRVPIGSSPWFFASRTFLPYLAGISSVSFTGIGESLLYFSDNSTVRAPCNGSSFRFTERNGFAECARRDFQVRASRDSTQILTVTDRFLFSQIYNIINTARARVCVRACACVCV